MKKETVNETINFCILLISVSTTLFFYILPNQTGFIYVMARQVQNVRIKLGMISDTLPILFTNILIFVMLNVIFGSLAFILLNRRTKRYSTATYGLLIPTIFLLITIPYAIFSDDKGSGPFAFIGAIVITVIQVPLANFILKDQSKES